MQARAVVTISTLFIATNSAPRRAAQRRGFHFEREQKSRPHYLKSVLSDVKLILYQEYSIVMKIAFEV